MIKLKLQHIFHSFFKQKGWQAPVWIRVRTKTWPRTCTEAPLCQSSTALHHAVSPTLVLGRVDNTVLLRTYVSPLTLESFTRHFTEKSCWRLVLRVFRDEQTGGWTWHRLVVCAWELNFKDSVPSHATNIQQLNWLFMKFSAHKSIFCTWG